jgi:chromosome segregation ATPase
MNAVLAYKPEYDEVAVVSLEVLDSNVTAMRGELTELKTDFKAHRSEFTTAISRLDNDIKSAVSELRAEIRAVAVKAASDLKEFADRVERQLGDMRAQIGATNAKLDVTNEKLTDLSKAVNHIGNKLSAMFWVIGGLIAIATFVVTVGKAVGWF